MRTRTFAVLSAASLLLACGAEAPDSIASSRSALTDVTVAAIQYGTGKSSVAIVDKNCSPLEDDDVTYGSLEERLASLSREGALRLGEPQQRLAGWKAVPSKGKRASRIISSDRDSR